MEHRAEPPQAESTTEGGTNAVAKRERERAPLVAVEGGVLPIMPRSIEEAQRYASGLIQAGIVPEAFKWNEKQARDIGNIELKGQPNAPLVLMGILKCLEIGVPPQTAIQRELHQAYGPLRTSHLPRSTVRAPTSPLATASR